MKKRRKTPKNGDYSRMKAYCFEKEWSKEYGGCKKNGVCVTWQAYLRGEREERKYKLEYTIEKRGKSNEIEREGEGERGGKGKNTV